MSLRSRIRVAVALLSLWGVPGWAAFEKSIQLCKNPTPAQKATLSYLAKQVGQSYEPSQCATLYDTLATAKKLGFLARENLDLAPFAELTQLKSLYILGPKRVDLTPLKELKSLEELKVHSEGEITNVQVIAGLAHLKNLSLNRNRRAEPPLAPLNLTFLKTLTNLEQLDLDENVINDIAPLTHLSSLRRLAIGSNQISDIQPLEKLRNLESLVLAGNNEISDIRPLQSMTKLKTLYLTRNKVRDLKPLAGLTALEELILDNNEIEDVVPLQGLVNMKKLVLSSNRLRDISPLRNLRNLRELMLSYNQITDTSVLTGMEHLIIFNVVLNPLRDCMPQAAHEIRAGMKCPDEKTPMGKNK